MKPALFHCVVSSPYGAAMRVMAVTSTKGSRHWGRDVSTEEPTNFRGSDVAATLTGPDGEAKAKALLAPLALLRKELSAKQTEAYRVMREATDRAEAHYKAAVLFEIEKLNLKVSAND